MIRLNNIQYNNIDKDLYFIINKPELLEEFNYFKNATPRKYSLFCKHNKIIRFFQQDVFFRNERELWQNDSIKERIIANRLKYIQTTPMELSTYDILTGFKKSGIYYGYSGFNPLLIKKFCLDNNISSLYDPCGGWGHRLLGCINLEHYIYNDLSTSTYNNINNIIEFFDIKNCTTYNNNANSFIPTEKFDAIFTCPPYFNIEKYECDNFKTRDEFDAFINNLFNIFYSSNAKIFGIVIREDLITNTNYTNKILLNVNISHHFNKNNSHKKYKEYLYIYKK